MIAPLRQLSGWLVLVCCCPWAWAGHASHRLERLANLDASRTPLSKDQNLDQLIQMGLPQSGPGSLVQDEDGQLLAYVHLHPDLAPDTTASSLTRFGIKVVHIAPQYGVMTVRGRPSALLRLSQMAQVSYVEEALAPATALHWQKRLAEETHKLPDLTLRNPLEGRLPPSCNQVVSEGDIVLGAAQARQQFAVSGKGVRIGILSDSFDVAPGLGHGAPHDIWFGELPGFNPFCGIHPPVEVIADAKPRQGAGEGRAMAQIIHDLAPLERVNILRRPSMAYLLLRTISVPCARQAPTSSPMMSSISQNLSIRMAPLPRPSMRSSPMVPSIPRLRAMAIFHSTPSPWVPTRRQPTAPCPVWDSRQDMAASTATASIQMVPIPVSA